MVHRILHLFYITTYICFRWGNAELDQTNLGFLYFSRSTTRGLLCEYKAVDELSVFHCAPVRKNNTYTQAQQLHKLHVAWLDNA